MKKEDYDGNIIQYLYSLKNEDINEILDELMMSEDLDERMDLADRILTIIQLDHPDDYNIIEDDVKDLTLN